MAGDLLLLLCHPGPGRERPILGLTGVHRSALGLARAGFDRIVAVRKDGLDEAGAWACVPDGLRDAARVVERLPGEEDADLVRRVALAGQAVAVLDSDVVVGPKDAADIAGHIAGGRALSVAEGLVLALPARAVAMLPPGAGLPEATEALRYQGVLDRVPPLLLVARLDGSDAARRQVEDRLLQGLRKPLDIDGVVGFYVQRPITTRISRLLARTRIRPNHLTLMAMAAGLSSGVLVALGDPLLAAAGGLLFLLGSFIDCLDGEVARLKFQFSRTGEWLDTVADDSSTLSFLAGTTIHLAARHESGLVAGLGVAACAAFVLASAYVYHRLATVIGSGDLTRFPYPFLKDDGAPVARRGVVDVLKFVIKRDFFSAFFCVCACLGILEAAFAFALVGMFAFAGIVAYTAWLQHVPALRAAPDGPHAPDGRSP